MNLPKNFNWKKELPQAVETPRNQQNCRSCWVFSTLGMVGDRFCIANKLHSIYLSPLWVMSACGEGGKLDCKECTFFSCKKMYGCQAPGNLFRLYEWLSTKEGYLKLEECWPYEEILQNKKYSLKKFFGNLDDNCCYNYCHEKNIISRVKFLPDLNYGCIYHGGELRKTYDEITELEFNQTIENIKKDIYENGPVVCGIMKTPPFMKFWERISYQKNFKNMIYDHEIDTSDFFNMFMKYGGHSMCIIGWEVDDKTGIEYWDVRNNYGTSLGDEGYIKIAISRYKDKNKWTGIDIPYYNKKDNLYLGGCASYNVILDKNIDLEYLIANNIFKRI